jgi:hypothetical protein
MAVAYLKYNNEKLPVKVGYYALKMMQKEHGANIEAVEGDLSLYEPLLFYALKQGHKLENKELTYKMEDMVDILDDCFFDFVKMLPEFFPTEELGKTMGGRKGK